MTRDAFEKAAADIKNAKSLSNDDLLALYGLYKQATQGDDRGSRPSFWDMTGQAKWDAWAKHAGMSRETAMGQYVELVQKLL